jgi:hypothetical protein
LLKNPALLQDVKASQPTATEIPQYIHYTKLTKSCLEFCQSTLTEVKKMSPDVKKAVRNAFEAKSFANEIVTTHTLAEMFTVHHNQMDTLITTRLAALQTTIPAEAAALVNQGLDDDFDLAHGVNDEEPTTSTTPPQIVYHSYSHSSFWHMPPHFALPPRMKLDTGWKIWFTGILCYQIETKDETAQSAPIWPFVILRTQCCQHIFEGISVCIGGQSLNLWWLVLGCIGRIPMLLTAGWNT